MPKIFSTIAALTRLNAPAAYLLVFFPALFGLLLAYEKPGDLKYIFILFIGSILTRSAGCIINDFFDIDIDRQVERTKNRPLASRSISKKTAFVILLVLLSMAFGLLLLLGVAAIIVGMMALPMIILYPLMKRITYFPQVFLGLTFNLGCLIGYAAVKDNISFPAIVMYAGCGLWTFGYDSIYAFMDIRDDKIVGVKSSAIFMEHKGYRKYLTCAYIGFILCIITANLLIANHAGAWGGAVALPVLLWQAATIDISKPLNCLARFKSNIYVGGIISLAMLLGCVI